MLMDMLSNLSSASAPLQARMSGGWMIMEATVMGFRAVLVFLMGQSQEG
jgi:hypothetical protein